ncbi:MULTISPECIES: SDR family oxidoreductase [unclassified Pseudonocardia]|uniref:SDR family NAD(P)-dependent oxidoreductase n=1 Tax=unclassified Pseudonocardia TaxID=2619320 RepID=UPI0001FFDBDD|nr:SDR family oxidoreductase [Pseudonocardia sp. Ae707_Ps1]OLM15910.1 3-oxoacyl-[acyl-carrier protein] reductase [Pseudonocardia sp. Ae707_Ps1]
MGWALVTGGATGIGAATVELLATGGTDVVCAGIDEQAAAGLAAELEGKGLPGRVRPARVDVSDVASVRALFAGLDEAGILPEQLVNCAGLNRRERAQDVLEESWTTVVDVNLHGTFEVCRAFADRLVAAGRPGRIVNITSMLAHYGAPGFASYAASKGGVLALTRTLAVEWAPHGIRVNAVSPGYVATPLAASLLVSGRFAEEIRARTPMGRIGSVEDVAPVIRFLLGDDSRFVTGQVIPVDGGITAGDLRLGPTGLQ